MNNLSINEELSMGGDLKVYAKGLEDKAVTPEVMAFYALRAGEMKQQIDKLAAETSLRQDRMRLINEIIAEINTLTDKNQSLDITKHLELQEKLRMAQQLGVKINITEFKFDAGSRDRLVQNLHLAADNWDKENKSQTQKMEIYIKELDRVMLLLKEAQKNENQAKRGATSGIKGS